MPEAPSASRFDVLVRDVAERYRSRRAAYYYVRSKLRMDPVSQALLALAAKEPFGTVADVACGRGQFGILLLVAGGASDVTGVDWDEAKVAAANEAGAALEARFAHGDVRTHALPAVDTALLVDVLHYLTAEEQDALLLRAARAARHRVIVRDIDPDRGTTSVLTRSWEWVTTSLGYNRGPRVAPRSFEAIGAVLEAEGFTVTRELCSAKGMSNVLLVARR